MKVTREGGEPPVVNDTHNNAEEKQSFLKSTRRFFNKKNKASLPAKLKKSPYGDAEKVIEKSPELKLKIKLSPKSKGDPEQQKSPILVAGEQDIQII